MRTGFGRALSAFAAGGVAVVLLVSSASAVTFITSSVLVTDASIDTDINYTSVGLNNNINLGTPLTISNFITATINTVHNGDNTGTISAAFTFTDPTAANTTDSGTIAGSFAGASSNLKTITVAWTDPLSLVFLDGTTLRIDLADTTFSCPSPSCAHNDSFNIAGTFTLLNGPIGIGNDGIATPIPAALPLFASGLGVLGLLGWRRKRKAVALAA
jgi:hypothetical protein